MWVSSIILQATRGATLIYYCFYTIFVLICTITNDYSTVSNTCMNWNHRGTKLGSVLRWTRLYLLTVSICVLWNISCLITICGGTKCFITADVRIISTDGAQIAHSVQLLIKKNSRIILPTRSKQSDFCSIIRKYMSASVKTGWMKPSFS